VQPNCQSCNLHCYPVLLNLVHFCACDSSPRAHSQLPPHSLGLMRVSLDIKLTSASPSLQILSFLITSSLVVQVTFQGIVRPPTLLNTLQGVFQRFRSMFGLLIACFNYATTSLSGQTLFAWVSAALFVVVEAQSGSTFNPARPPAIPLAVKSPYFSSWLQAGSDGGNGGYLPGKWPQFHALVALPLPLLHSKT